MVVLRILAVLAGIAVAGATLLSAVRTVVLPRAAGSLVTRAWFITVRRLFDVFGRRETFEGRDRILAYYAPIALVMLPGVWIALVIAAFTGIFWGIGVHPLREAFLVSGSSVLTLGVAFRQPAPDAIVTFVEATLGLGLVALLISYLPSIYGAFARRELMVGKLEVRAGLPPSPAALFARYSRIGYLDNIDIEFFARWEDWFMEVEESHTSLPALVFFRSPQPERSWVTAAGCVLDSAAIYLSTIRRDVSVGSGSGPASVLIRTGFLTLRRIADSFGIAYNTSPSPTDPISVTRAEFDLVCDELVAAGIELLPDGDQAWRDYAGWRVNYDTVLLALAALVEAPPGLWSSDRSMLDRPRPRIIRRTHPRAGTASRF